MTNREEYNEQIERYLEGKMTLEEEQLFIQQLNANEELRNQYEDELLLLALLNNKETEQNKDPFLLQSTDKHISTTETSLPKKKESTVISLFKKYAAIAAVIIFISGSIITWVIVNHRTLTNTPVATTIDTSKLKDSEGKENSMPLPKQTAPIATITKKTEDKAAINNDSLYASLYTPYAVDEKNDPAELSDVYNNLKKGNLNKVISVNEGDIQMMGADNRNELLKQYLHLYKGIAYLAQNKSSNAIVELNNVMKYADKTEPQYYEAQWYSALAAVKRNDTEKAAILATNIIHSNSPYKNKAGQLLKAMSNTSNKKQSR